MIKEFFKKHLPTLVFASIYIVLITAYLFTLNKYVVLLAFGTAVIGLMFGKKEDRFAFLVFLLPFSRIFKINIGRTSLFTFLLVEYWGLIILDYIIEKRKIEKKILIPLFIYTLLFVYFGIQSIVLHEIASFKRVISFMLYLLIPLAFFVDIHRVGDEDKTNIVQFMIFGFASTIVISLLSYVFKDFAKNLFYIIDDKVGIIQGVRRFSGLFGDSNYYGFYSLILLSLLVLNYKNLQFKYLNIGLGLFILIIGYLSLSMMYISISIILIIGFFINLIRKKPLFAFKSYILVVLVLLVLMFIMGDKIMGIVMAKIGDVDNLDDFATGRLTIWNEYIEFFKLHPVRLIFGNGINSVHAGPGTVSKAAHNMFFETLYDMGIIGGTLFVFYYLELFKIYNVSKESLKNKKLLCFIVAFVLCGLLVELAESDYTVFFLTTLAISIGNIEKDNQDSLEEVKVCGTNG